MTAPVLPRRLWAVVPAAGRGTRFASAAPAVDDVTAASIALPKQYAPLAGATVIEWSLAALVREPRVAGIVVALAEDDAHWPQVAAALNSAKLRTATGGANRHQSVLNGLKSLDALAAPQDWVLVHDAARPCLTAEDLTALIDALGQSDDGVVLAAPIVDTVKRQRAGERVETADRDGLWRALTPQIFGFARLSAALNAALSEQVAVTDEAQAMERAGFAPALVQGSPFNIKVTRAADLVAAAAILQNRERTSMRIGTGFDVHTFGAGDHVMLGGVRIDYGRGVVAHSDGDVVIHALCDAVLGALGRGDIGQHFPDTDPRYRGADSRVFLREVAAQMSAAGLRLVNADVTVLAEAPRIAKFRTAMAVNLAADLGTEPERINIKATTTERLGFVGRGEGLAAQAAVLLER